MIPSNSLCWAVTSGQKDAYRNTLAALEYYQYDLSVVNGRDYQGLTALQHACYDHRSKTSSIETLLLLLSIKGIDVNTCNGNTDELPLVICLMHGHPTDQTTRQAVQALLACDDLDINVTTTSGHGIVAFAGQWGYDDYFRILLLDRRFNGNLTYYNDFTLPAWDVLVDCLEQDILPRLFLNCLRNDFNISFTKRMCLAIASSTRLVSFACTNWQNVMGFLYQKNASIVDTGDAKNVPKEVVAFCERNRKARHMCVAAALVVGGHLKRTQGRDMSRLFMEWIWDTRGEHAWLFMSYYWKTPKEHIWI